MYRTQSVVSLDPIDRNRRKNPGIIGRLFITRRFRGKPVSRTDEFGHYMFCGPQRSSKTVSMIWFMEELKKKYEKKKCRVHVYSNIGIGEQFNRHSLFHLLETLTFNKNDVYIFMIDEIHSWFPKDTKDKNILV